MQSYKVIPNRNYSGAHGYLHLMEDLFIVFLSGSASDVFRKLPIPYTPYPNEFDGNVMRCRSYI